MFGDKQPSRRLVRHAATEEEGSAAIETALLLGLAAFCVFTMKHVLADPLLATFTRAVQALSQALG